MEANTPRIGWIEEAAAVVSCLASTLCIPSSSLLGSLSSKAESMRFSKHERGNLSSPLMQAERSISWWERQTPTSPGFAKGGGCGINCFLLRPQLIVPALAGDAHWVSEAQARQPNLACTEHKTLCFHISELHSHYLRWLLLYSLGGEQLVLPISERSVVWGPNPPALWGTIGMEPSRQPWPGTAWGQLALICSLPRCHCVPDTVYALKPFSWKGKGGILGLLLGSRPWNPQKPNQLISTKELWGEGQGCPLPQGSSESICMWTPSCLYKGSLSQEKHEWWLTQPIKLFYNCICKNGVN